MKILAGFVVGAVTGVAVSAIVMNQIHHSQQQIRNTTDADKSSNNSNSDAVNVDNLDNNNVNDTIETVEESVVEESVNDDVKNHTTLPCFKIIFNNMIFTCHEGVDYDNMEAISPFARVKPHLRSKFDLLLKRHLKLDVCDSIESVDLVLVTKYKSDGTADIPLCKLINVTAQMSRATETVCIRNNITSQDIKSYLGIDKTKNLLLLKFALILSRLDQESIINVLCEYTIMNEDDIESFVEDFIAAQIGDILYK